MTLTVTATAHPDNRLLAGELELVNGKAYIRGVLHEETFEAAMGAPA